MRRTVSIALVMALTGIGLSALPWMRDMFTGPTVLPYERLMTPPEGTLSINGPRIMDRLEAEERLTNPLQASAKVLEEGAALYGIYCTPCHGPKGAGDGPVSQHFRRVPDLSAEYIQNYADGWMYSILREGGFAMPGYAESLSVDERWAVVHHIRTIGTK